MLENADDFVIAHALHSRTLAAPRLDLIDEITPPTPYSAVRVPCPVCRGKYTPPSAFRTHSTKISLPSAADLFDSVEANSASYMSAPVPLADTPLTTPKRKNKDGGGSGSGSGAKKSKASSTGDKKAAGKGGGGGSGPSRGLIPPQMSRPNIVTEDSALWSSDSTIKRQRQVEAEKKGRARKEKDAEKGGKDSLSYKQREKVCVSSVA